MSNIVQDLKIEIQNFIEDQLIDPTIEVKEFYYKDGTKVILDHQQKEIAASASNKIFTLDSDSDVKMTWVWNQNLDTGLTATFDSDPVAYEINPIQARSGQINTITVSNSIATSTTLSILRILVQSST